MPYSKNHIIYIHIRESNLRLPGLWDQSHTQSHGGTVEAAHVTIKRAHLLHQLFDRNYRLRVLNY